LFNKKAITRLQAIVIAVVIIVAAIGAGSYYYFIMTQREKPFIVVSTWGGFYLDGWKKIIPKFEEEYGIEVRFFEQGGSMEVYHKIRAEKAHPPIDVAYVGEHVSILLMEEGLLVPLDNETVPNLNYIDPYWIPTGIQWAPFSAYYFGWTICPDLIPKELAYNGTLEWFLDPAFKGKFLFPAPWWTDMMTWACLETGDEFNLDAGFELLKKLAPNCKFVYSGHAEVEAAMSAGEAWAAFASFHDMYYSHKAGLKVICVKSPPPPLLRPIGRFEAVIPVASNPLCVVRNTGKEDLAIKFVNWAISPEIQAEFNNDQALGMTLKNPPSIPEDIAGFVPTADEYSKYAYRYDLSWWGPRADLLVERWEKEITPLVGG